MRSARERVSGIAIRRKTLEAATPSILNLEVEVRCFRWVIPMGSDGSGGTKANRRGCDGIETCLWLFSEGFAPIIVKSRIVKGQGQR